MVKRIGSLRLLSPSLRQKISKRMPLALAGIGAAGVIGTGVTSAMAAVKAFKHLERENLVNGTKWEQFKAMWRYFMLPTGVSLATIASILSGALLSHKHEASILASYGLLKAGYEEYRKQAKALLGDKMEENLHKSVEYTVAEKPTDKPKTEELWFYLDFRCNADPTQDAPEGQLFNAEMVDVLNAFLELNRRFMMKGTAKVNDLLGLLGLVQTMDGEEYGWNALRSMNDQEFMWIDFDIELTTLEDGLECYNITFPFGNYPQKGYIEVF